MNSTHPSRGIALILGSSVAFCVMSCLAKFASSVDVFMITQFRFVVGLLLLATAAMFRRIHLSFVHGPLLLARGLAGGAGVCLSYLSIFKLGIGTGTVISYAHPVFAGVLGAFFLKEKKVGVKLALAAVAMAGIVLLSAKPGADSPLSLSFGVYELLAVLGAVMSGIAVVIVKKLHETDSTYAIFFAQCLIGLWMVIIPANVVGESLGYSGGTLLLIIGVTAAVGQLLMAEGYRHVPVTSGSLLSMLVPVLNFVAGILLFHEPVTWLRVIGSLVVMACCALVVVIESAPQSMETRAG